MGLSGYSLKPIDLLRGDTKKHLQSNCGNDFGFNFNKNNLFADKHVNINNNESFCLKDNHFNTNQLDVINTKLNTLIYNTQTNHVSDFNVNSLNYNNFVHFVYSGID